MIKLLYAGMLSVIVALGGFLLGFDFSVISGVLPFIEKYFSLNEWELGFTATAINFGAISGTLIAGPIIDAVGRKKVLIVCAILYTVSAVLSALAIDFVTFNIARIIGGLAIGASIITAPVYVAEIAPPKYRGRLVGINQFTIVLGISIAYFSNYFLLEIGENNWRWMLGVEAFPALFYFFFLLGIPESPRWLVMKKRENEARNVLLKVVNEQDAELELGEIHNSLVNQQKGIYSDLIKGKMIRIMIIAIVLGLCQQMSGVNAVFSYAPMIFEKSGAGRQAAFMSAVFVGLVNLLFTILAVWLMDRIGRRPLLMAGALGMTLSHITLMLTSHFNNFEGILVLIAILVFIASFATSVGPGYWILVSEILPNRLRGLAISIIQGLTSLASMVVVLLFPWELIVVGITGTFFIYAVITAFTVFLVYYFIPETKGKSLEEIELEVTK
jgi:SP family arabinose:H+ symporter-like MFS transporter